MFRKAILGVTVLGATAGFAAPPVEELTGLWGRNATVREFMPALERDGRRTTWLVVTPVPGCDGTCLEGKVRNRAVATHRQGAVWSFHRSGRFYTVIDEVPLLGGRPAVVVTEAALTTRAATPELPFRYAPARPMLDIDLGTSRAIVLPLTTAATVQLWVAQAAQQGFTMLESGRDGVWRCERAGRQLYIHVLSESGRMSALIMDIRE